MSRRRRIRGAALASLVLLFSSTSTGVAGLSNGVEGLASPTISTTDGRPRVDGELLVKWKQPDRLARDRPAIRRLLSSVNARISRDVPQVALSRISLPEAKRERIVTALASSPLVEWVEPNYVIELDYVPDDPFYDYQRPYLSNMEMEAAWDITHGDPDIVVAVIDTGIDFNHSDLDGAIWQNSDEAPGNELDDDDNGYVDDVAGWDFFQDDNDPTDLHGHGTHVSGIVAARTGNGLGVAGIAGQTTIMPLGIFHPAGFGTYADLIEAIIYATDNGARVINMSLGAISYSRGEEAAVNYAWEHGVVLFGAAGNESNDALHYPSSHEHVISVSSVDAFDVRSGFSSYGDTIALSAPGSNVFSTYRGNGYGPMGGTSMATPQAAGLAALILARNPTLTNGEVRAILETTADDLGEPGWDRFFGHGRVNGRKALEATWIPEPPLPAPPEPPEPEPIFPDYCRELVINGGFERPDLSPWSVGGEAVLDDQDPFSGDQSLLLAFSPSGAGEASQWIDIPVETLEATLYFAMSIVTTDWDFGPDPNDPHDDRIEASFRDADGTPIVSLLRAGNKSDSGEFHFWDEYLYRLASSDLETLKQQTPVQLHFKASNNDDEQTTRFRVDFVRFCVDWPSMQSRVFVPVVIGG